MRTYTYEDIIAAFIAGFDESREGFNGEWLDPSWTLDAFEREMMQRCKRWMEERQAEGAD